MSDVNLIAKALKNITARLSRGGADSPVYAVNNGAPDSKGNVDLSYLARRDQNTDFAGSVTFNGGIGNIVIPANTDVATLTTSGWYRVTDSSVVATLTNAPNVNSGFIMQVVGNSTSFPVQLAWEIQTGRMMIQALKAGGIATPWTNVLRPSEIQSATNVGNGKSYASLDDVLMTCRLYFGSDSATTGVPSTVKTPYYLESMSNGSTGVGNRVMQRITTASAINIFVRYYDGTKWHDWTQLSSVTA